jgi:membrane-associated protease RseP (regulator of RpoE activity)
MRNRQLIGFIAIILWTAAPSLFGQDFLKQLEEKLLQKQSAKETEKKDPELATEPALKLGDESSNGTTKPAPLVLNPSEAEEALPAPRKKPLTPAQPSKSSSKPAPVPPPKPGIIPSPKQGIVPAENPGFLGMTVESSVGGGFGLSVVSVTANSPAWKAGFRPGDRVIGVNGNAVTTVDNFAEQLSQFGAGTPVKFLVDRRGKNVPLTAVLMDKDVAARIHGSVPPPNTLPNSGNSQAYLGVNVSDMSPAFRSQFSIPAYRGASVTEVIDGSPAARAGLRPGDCIVAFKGQEVRSAEDVLNAILDSRPGETVNFTYYRGISPKQGSATLTRADGLELPTLAGEISQEMLTPDYVVGLHTELERVSAELRAAQDRIVQLEASLRQLERQR